MKCPKCNGQGRVVIQTRMPKRGLREAYWMDEPVKCPECGGTGVVEPPAASEAGSKTA